SAGNSLIQITWINIDHIPIRFAKLNKSVWVRRLLCRIRCWLWQFRHIWMLILRHLRARLLTAILVWLRLPSIRIIEPIQIVIGIVINVEMPHVAAVISSDRISTQEPRDQRIVIALLHGATQD